MKSLIACFCICASTAVFADAPSAEEVLKARLPEIFAKSAAHYKALDAAATPLDYGDYYFLEALLRLKKE